MALPCSSWILPLKTVSNTIEQRKLRSFDINGQADLEAFNPAFDITDGGLVTAFVTDQGVFTPSELIVAKSLYIGYTVRSSQG